MNIRLVRETNHRASWFGRLVHCVLASVLSVTPAILFAGATRIAGGDHHTCAVRLNGTVACWGRNHRGQLGNGSERCWGHNQDGQVGNGLFEYGRTTPVAVSGLTGGSQITGGNLHTCTTLTSGAARCWGHNAFGQLGNGSLSDSATPTVVQNFP